MSKEEKKNKKVVKSGAPVVEKTPEKKVKEIESRKAELKAKNAKKASATAKTQSAPPPPFPKKIDGVANPLMTNSRLKTAMCIVIGFAYKWDKDKTAEGIRNCGMLYKLASGDFDNMEPLKPTEWSGLGYVRLVERIGKEFLAEAGNAPEIVAVIPFIKAMTKVEELDKLGKGLSKIAETAIVEKKAKLKARAEKMLAGNAEKKVKSDKSVKSDKKTVKPEVKADKKAVKPEVKSEKKVEKKVKK